ncbi:hypothetical protein KSP40_PGU009550 [Platanthera guangdongensis]|uniref:Mitochondrial import inner membrane translocase subunit Tim16 n=1 Tax=Platanthera guangdongensis TaxID=2320717 RepID=A0ABR2N2P1_9ASPA
MKRGGLVIDYRKCEGRRQRWKRICGLLVSNYRGIGTTEMCGLLSCSRLAGSDAFSGMRRSCGREERASNSKVVNFLFGGLSDDSGYGAMESEIHGVLTLEMAEGMREDETLEGRGNVRGSLRRKRGVVLYESLLTIDLVIIVIHLLRLLKCYINVGLSFNVLHVNGLIPLNCMFIAFIDANKSGVAQETIQNIRRSGRSMTEQEARLILGLKENATWEEVVQKYDALFERNSKMGSLYLQSKVHRAKECLEAVYQKNDPSSGE